MTKVAKLEAIARVLMDYGEYTPKWAIAELARKILAVLEK